MRTKVSDEMKPTPQGFEWNTAASTSPTVVSGHARGWGWMMSAGLVPDEVPPESPVHAQKWIEKAHAWLTAKAKVDLNHDGSLASVTVLPKLFEYLNEEFAKEHPELVGDRISNAKRPWIDFAFVTLCRSRSGVQIRFFTTSLITFAVHNGTHDSWTVPTGTLWRNALWQPYAEKIARTGIVTASGKSHRSSWSAICRKMVNKTDGPGAWILGMSNPQRSMTAGSVHLSEPPFSMAFFNQGTLMCANEYGIFKDNKEMFDFIRSHRKIDGIFDKAKTIEKNDPEARKIPREKLKMPMGILYVHGD